MTLTKIGNRVHLCTKHYSKDIFSSVTKTTVILYKTSTKSR